MESLQSSELAYVIGHNYLTILKLTASRCSQKDDLVLLRIGVAAEHGHLAI